MADTPEDRVVQALSAVGLSEAQALKLAGKGKNALAEWKAGRKMPVGFVQWVLRECLKRGTKISGHWILTGEDAMIPAPAEAKVDGFDRIAAIVDEIRAAGDAGGADDVRRAGPD